MLTYRGTRAELDRLLRSIPRALAGGPDPNGIAEAVQVRVGMAALSEITDAFITKSRGGVGSDGIAWKSLKRETIAQRRVGSGDLSALGIKGTKHSRVRGLLTKEQDAKWRAIYRSVFAKLVVYMGPTAAGAKAAMVAWGVLKKEGALTKLAVLGGRIVDIGRDTGRTLRSFSPGHDAASLNDPGVDVSKPEVEDQKFETPPGMAIVGTNVPYAEKFAETRPFWPAGGVLPDTWAEACNEALQTGITRAITLLVEGGSRA